MGLTSKARTTLMDKIDVAMLELSKAAPMPKSKDNKSPIAWDYWFWYTVQSLVKGKFEAAKKAAIRNDIIFDPAKEQIEHEVGIEPYFEGEHVIAWLTVKNGYEKTDTDTMVKYLLEHNVDPEVVMAALRYAKVRTKRPHEFKPVLASE